MKTQMHPERCSDDSVTAADSAHVNIIRIDLGGATLIVVVLLVTIIGACGVMIGLDIAERSQMEREFAKLEGGAGADGSTIDAAGRIYVTSGAGVQVIGPDGKYLGLIPTPRDVISVTFSGPDRKTLYAVSRDNAQNKDWIIALEMIAPGPKGRGK